MKKNDKKVYETPVMERVNLDNEISLILQSLNPWVDPIGNNSNHLNNDPFKTDIA